MRARSSPRTCVRPPTCSSSVLRPLCSSRPAPAPPGSAGSRAPPSIRAIAICPSISVGVEQLVGRHRDLTRAVGGTDPGPDHRDPAPTQGHRARLRAVPGRVLSVASIDDEGVMVGDDVSSRI